MTEPSQVAVAGCLAMGQSLYGATAVVGRVGLKTSNPLAFNIWRFCAAAPLCQLLLAWKEGWHKAVPELSFLLFLLAGCLIGANLGMTLGVVLSGQVTATAWQPLQLVFTTLLSLVLGLEAASFRKVLGLAFGMAGACIIVARQRGPEGGAEVFLDPSMWAPGDGKSSGWGHVALFVNSMCSSSMVVLRRHLILGSKGLSAFQIMAWSHIVGLPLLIMLGLAGNQSAAFRDAVCDGCVSVTAPPMSAVGWMALGFYTVVPTIICQSLLTWSAKYAEPTMMALFPVLQPLASAALSWLLWQVEPSLREVLAPPEWNLLGALPVVVGVWLVSSAQRKAKSEARPKGKALKRSKS